MANVIEIGDFRIARKERSYTRELTECPHHWLELDDKGGLVQCTKCKVYVSAFWALSAMTAHINERFESVGRREKAAAEAAERQLSLTAAQAVERAWRKRSMVPSCPHCNEAIFPGDGFGHSLVNKALALRRRAMKAQRIPRYPPKTEGVTC